MGCGKTFFRTYEVGYAPDSGRSAIDEIALLLENSLSPVAEANLKINATEDISQDIVLPLLPLTLKQVSGIVTALFDSLRFIPDESE